jgi:hypothetical protein
LSEFEKKWSKFINLTNETFLNETNQLNINYVLNGEASGLQLNGNDFINGIDPQNENSNIDHRILKVIFENVDQNPALRNVNRRVLVYF